jgi:hypothetical protein
MLQNDAIPPVGIERDVATSYYGLLYDLKVRKLKG